MQITGRKYPQKIEPLFSKLKKTGPCVRLKA